MAHQRMSQYMSPGQSNDRHAAGERVREAYGRAQEMVAEHPAYSALACFGIGVGVGAAITLLLAPEKEKKEQAWYADYLPDEDFTHELSKHVRETVSRMLPDAVARYLKRR
jgi:hypothetical protein